MRYSDRRISDIKQIAKKKLPRFIYQYLEGGTEEESQFKRNREKLDEILFKSKICKDINSINTKVELFGRQFSAPFGIAPIGLSGLIWPRSEELLAKMAQKKNIPYCLSTVSTITPEKIGDIKCNKWFQLYPPRDSEILNDLLLRAKKNHFETLVVTGDIPMPSRRESLKKEGFTLPPKIGFDLIKQSLEKPSWGIRTLMNGVPRLRTIEKYTSKNNMKFVSGFVGNRLGGTLTWDYLREIREMWSGPLILKGIICKEDALVAYELGIDAIVVSNHGSRQFDGNIPTINALQEIAPILRDKMTIIYDSGISSGLDIMRALSIGAHFVLIGRPFLYGFPAIGNKNGGELIYKILQDQLINNMAQIGVSHINEIFQSHV